VQKENRREGKLGKIQRWNLRLGHYFSGDKGGGGTKTEGHNTIAIKKKEIYRGTGKTDRDTELPRGKSNGFG